MAKHIASMDEAYAVKKVAEIDDRLATIKEESAALAEKRKLYAPHLPKKPSAKKD